VKVSRCRNLDQGADHESPAIPRHFQRPGLVLQGLLEDHTD